MKKLFIIIAAFLSLSSVKGQCVLEHTFNGPNARVPQLPLHNYPQIIGDIIMVGTDIIDAHTFTTITTMPNIPNINYIICIAKGFFTTDNRVCFVVETYDDALVGTNEHVHYYLYDENGTILQDFGSCAYNDGTIGVFKLSNGIYYLCIGRYFSTNNVITEIYSLPGDGGNTTAFAAPVSSKTSPIRKVTRKGHIVIKDAVNTYTLHGQKLEGKD